MARPKLVSDPVLLALREFGLQYPGAHLKSPWPDHCDLAVKDKTFAYLSQPGDPFSISCKLPRSGAVALALPFSEPTGYGLGKSGWVTASFTKGELPPLDLFKAWIDESYRAQAPKKWVAELDARAPAQVLPARAKKKSAAANKSKRLAATSRTAKRTGGARRTR
jgi:hypothetical protein